MLSAYPILQYRLKALHNMRTQSKHNTMYHHISNVLLFYLIFFSTLLLTLIPFVCANIFFFFHFHSTIAVFACFFKTCQFYISRTRFIIANKFFVCSVPYKHFSSTAVVVYSMQIFVLGENVRRIELLHS